MELDDAITITKIDMQNHGECYLMIAWQLDSFDVYIYNKENLWKGRFSANRLLGFSKNLNVSEVTYFENVKKCLSQSSADYKYELRSGFFYWKRQINGSLILEGFLPMELEKSPNNTHPDLIEILISLNNHLKEKVNGLKYKFETIKSDYQQCLRDTDEFLGLKIDMEKTLCDKFLTLLDAKKTEVNTLQHTHITAIGENKE